jgi:hypothetical protein
MKVTKKQMNPVEETINQGSLRATVCSRCLLVFAIVSVPTSSFLHSRSARLKFTTFLHSSSVYTNEKLF